MQRTAYFGMFGNRPHGACQGPKPYSRMNNGKGIAWKQGWGDGSLPWAAGPHAQYALRLFFVCSSPVLCSRTEHLGRG
jgi:hypothetical protein